MTVDVTSIGMRSTLRYIVFDIAEIWPNAKDIF